MNIKMLHENLLAKRMKIHIPRRANCGILLTNITNHKWIVIYCNVTVARIFQTTSKQISITDIRILHFHLGTLLSNC